MSPRTARKDPICSGRCDNFVGRVSWPANLTPGKGEPSASTYVCADATHQADAADWVESVTGHRGVFVPWETSRG
ncbi:hypothetical protein [Nonomuraea sp. NPDC050202]|uniref:hypothetical protein n=1 Tax=Nonomuraea sp. NPDC050202 TaxID=3155035 RepID=UPI0033C69C5C